MATDGSNFELKIVNFSFFVRNVTINSGAYLRHIEKLEKQLQAAVYPIYLYICPHLQGQHAHFLNRYRLIVR